MPTDAVRLQQELSILADLRRGSDPLLASLSVAIFLEDAADIVLSDEEIEDGLVDPSAMARVTRQRRGST